MKRTLVSLISFSILFTACNQSNSANVPASDSTVADKVTKPIPVKSLPERNGLFSQFIPIDSANKMLGSYLNSINYQQNDTDLHSISFDANQVRKLLSDPNISNIKIMFAHSLDYINAGGKNISCGYCSKELTVIISGYDSAGNNLYNPAGTVLEIGNPCPPNCHINRGEAHDLLTVAASRDK